MKRILLAIFCIITIASCKKKNTYTCAYYYNRNGSWQHTGSETKQMTEEEVVAVLAANNKSNTKAICAKK